MYDPSEVLATVDCPALAVFGELDRQVPPEGNLERMARVLEDTGHPQSRVIELAGLNHFFQPATTGSPVEYGEIETTISPTALELIGDWIVEQTNADPSSP